MNPTLDHLLVVAVVLGALVFFAKRFVRRPGKSCDSGCGCGTTRKKINRP